MDRLSAYAAREAEADGDAPEDRAKLEEEATVKLMEKLRIAKEKKDNTAPKQQNGDAAQGEQSTNDAASAATTATAAETTADEQPENTEQGEVKKTRGIPENVKLFEIFHGQVASLVTIQRLPLQDTIAMLVSLANLAM